MTPLLLEAAVSHGLRLGKRKGRPSQDSDGSTRTHSFRDTTRERALCILQSQGRASPNFDHPSGVKTVCDNARKARLTAVATC